MEWITKHYHELTTDELYEILRTRQEIFVVEQDCPCMDIDGKDKESVHVFCKDGDRVTACLRVFMRDKDHNVAQIGRVVTLIHGKGLGKILLNEGIKAAMSCYNAYEIYLESQTYAVGYYEGAGFKVISGEEFLVDGIPHVAMVAFR